MKTIVELDKDDNRSIGVYENEHVNSDGTKFLAMTFTKSKWFKSEKGALSWLNRNYKG